MFNCEHNFSRSKCLLDWKDNFSRGKAIKNSLKSNCIYTDFFALKF